MEKAEYKNKFNIMDFLTPYLKYFLYFFAIGGFLWTNRIFITDPKLRAWLMQSFEDENGRTSSKNLGAFACVMAIVSGWFIAIHYAPNHTAPDYYLYVMAGLVTSLYAVKEVGKFMNTKYSAPFSNGNNGSNNNSNGNGGSAPDTNDKKQGNTNIPEAD